MTITKMMKEIFQEYNDSHPVMDVRDYAFLKYPNSVEGFFPWTALTKAYREVYNRPEVDPMSQFSLAAMDHWSALLGKTSHEVKRKLESQSVWREFESYAHSKTHSVSTNVTLARYTMGKFARAFLYNQADRFDEADKFTYLMTYGEEMKPPSLYDEEYSADELVCMWSYFESLTAELAMDYLDKRGFIPKWPALPSSICDAIRKSKLDKIWDSEERDHGNRKKAFGINPGSTFVYRMMRVEGLQRVRSIYNSRDPGTQFAVIMGLGFDPEHYSIEIEVGAVK